MHNDIKDKFEKALIERVGKIKLGNGFDSDRNGSSDFSRTSR